MTPTFELLLQTKNSEMVRALVSDVSAAIKKLLENKHLYQSETVEQRALEKFLEELIRGHNSFHLNPDERIIESSLSTVDWKELTNKSWRLIIEGV